MQQKRQYKERFKWHTLSSDPSHLLKQMEFIKSDINKMKKPKKKKQLPSSSLKPTCLINNTSINKIMEQCQELIVKKCLFFKLGWNSNQMCPLLRTLMWTIQGKKMSACNFTNQHYSNCSFSNKWGINCKRNGYPSSWFEKIVCTRHD